MLSITTNENKQTNLTEEIVKKFTNFNIHDVENHNNKYDNNNKINNDNTKNTEEPIVHNGKNNDIYNKDINKERGKEDGKENGEEDSKEDGEEAGEEDGKDDGEEDNEEDDKNDKDYNDEEDGQNSENSEDSEDSQNSEDSDSDSDSLGGYIDSGSDSESEVCRENNQSDIDSQEEDSDQDDEPDHDNIEMFKNENEIDSSNNDDSQKPSIEQGNEDKSNDTDSGNFMSMLAQIKTLMSNTGPIVKMVRLQSNGLMDELTVDMTPKLNAHAAYLNNEPSILGSYEDLGVVLLITKNQENEGLEISKHNLLPPFNKSVVRGDVLLIRMDSNSNPVDFTLEEYKKWFKANETN
jgi:hypothetical protein